MRLALKLERGSTRSGPVGFDNLNRSISDGQPWLGGSGLMSHEDMYWMATSCAHVFQLLALSTPPRYQISCQSSSRPHRLSLHRYLAAAVEATAARSPDKPSHGSVMWLLAAHASCS